MFQTTIADHCNRCALRGKAVAQAANFRHNGMGAPRRAVFTIARRREPRGTLDSRTVAMEDIMNRLIAAGFLLASLVGWRLGPAWSREAPTAGVTPGEAIARLKEGNSRFCHDHCLHPHEDARRRVQTAVDGQHPFAAVLACSDSRVPVEILFDQGIGDIFSIRVAGNVCGVDELGTVDYVVEHLAVPLLVILGHTDCGAVTAATVGMEVPGTVKAIVDKISPAVHQAHVAHPELNGKALVPCAIEANVWHAVEEILSNSPIARERIAAGHLKVVGAIYDVKSGQVKWLGEHPQQGELLKKTGEQAPGPKQAKHSNAGESPTQGR